MTWPEVPNYYEAPKQGYKVILQQPQYPVVFPEPSVTQVVTNMRPSSLALAAGMAAFGGAAGYWKGSSIHWQRPAMYFGAALLGKTGLLWGMCDSAYRLMGYKENSVEVDRNMPGLLKREAY
mmetsp:Transcript_12456/g.30607  ORF Transcript_12456/g.30607 Transcript_12456/m.30607 type:complete len:122 (+) Transcript_12456:44-409(+)